MSFVDQKLLTEPFKISDLNHATHIDPEQMNSNQTSFIVQALFQEIKSRQPSPPSAFASVTVSPATLAEWEPSDEPCHRNELQRELIPLMHCFG